MAAKSKSNLASSVFWPLLTFACLALACYAALFVAPEEKTMGVIQRIFYFHVPSFWTAFLAIFTTTYGSVAYIATKKMKWDWIAVSAAELAAAFLTIGLVTGPIWAKPVWGVWWAWDARTTSTFVLWAMYVSYLLLRTLVDEPERRALLSAVVAIFSCIDVPLVYFSIWMYRTQHPQPVIGDGGYLDPRMGKVLLECWGALVALFLLLLRERYRLEKMRSEVDGLRMEVERRGL
ncbi:MAG TPA: cytochrome c biogenesis protein CcsA [Candidatus Acidoferrales bacterium]|nr:cytochrome c biogenesis protein CcsA [Candidatus Acidoferrales bacterium]